MWLLLEITIPFFTFAYTLRHTHLSKQFSGMILFKEVFSLFKPKSFQQTSWLFTVQISLLHNLWILEAMQAKSQSIHIM